MKINQIIALFYILVIVSSNGLLVTGRASRSLSTSVAVLKFELVGSNKDPSKSISMVQLTLDKLKKALKGQIEKDSVNSTPIQIEMSTTNQGKVAFYQAIIEVQLAVTKNIGQIINKADKFGTLIDLTYRTSDQDKQKLKAKLVKQAFQQAQEKAEKYAQSIGVELDGIQLIEVKDEIQNKIDQSEVIVEVEVLYSLFNPDDDNDEILTTDIERQELKSTDLIPEDETKYQQINEHNQDQSIEEQQNQKQQKDDDEEVEIQVEPEKQKEKKKKYAKK